MQTKKAIYYMCMSVLWERL